MKDRKGVLAYVGGLMSMTHHTFTQTQTDTHYRHHLDNAQDPKARAARFSSYRTPEDTGLKIYPRRGIPACKKGCRHLATGS